MKSKSKKISGWGNYSHTYSEVYRPESLRDLQKIVKNEKKILAFGSNLSYGDSSLAETTIDMKRMDKMISFDIKNGVVKAEGGIILDEIIKIVVPQGWFFVVTPGTKYVTLGGCVASNVHGKNHHEQGSFISCVLSMEIINDNGELVECSKTHNADLFHATFGGMGLTGIIYSVVMKLKKIESKYVSVKYEKCSNMDVIFDKLGKYDKAYEYTVVWIDCLARGKNLGRGVIIAGNHSKKTGDLELTAGKNIHVPLYLPRFLLNKLFLKIFNTIFYNIHPDTKKEVYFDKFFYPLDAIKNWNRLYGRKGFVQYQFVVPLKDARSAVKEILNTVLSCGEASFLSVLKMFKDEDFMLSFPKEGYTLAMDFPATKRTAGVIKMLDEIVLKYGGRLYLTKDSFMDSKMLHKNYPKIEEWKKIKRKYDPEVKFTSLQAKRVGLV